ncbi:MAG: DUF2809 domain-containing protein [Planctomycetes bacterium]|nr:DUF2809 domain-containing protein [Planctomycetota bacterium]
MRLLLQLAGVIALGLLSRRVALPGFLAEHTGDALYAVAAFCATAVVFPAATSRSLVCAAFLFAAGVEFAQLLNWPWLRELRMTSWGALLLGQGFQRTDLVAYAVGAVAAGLLDHGSRRGEATPG